MKIEEFKNCIKEIKIPDPIFLHKIQGKERKGLFKYFLSPRTKGELNSRLIKEYFR